MPLILPEGTSQGLGQVSDSLSPPAETLGALASVVSLWMVTGILLYLAFIRLLHSDYHIEGGAMLLTASIAVCANLLYVPVWSRRHGGRWLSPCPDRRATGTHSSHLSPALGLPEDRREGDLESRVSRHLLRAYCVPATLLGAFISTVSFEAHNPPP